MLPVMRRHGKINGPKNVKKLNAWLDAHPEVRSRAGKVGGEMTGPKNVKKMNAWLDAHPEVRSEVGKTGGEAGGPIVFDKVRHLVKPRSRRRERATVRFLRSIGLKDAVRGSIEIGGYRPDVFVPSKKVIIEIDGFMHGTTEARAYDRRRDKELRKLGYRTVRIRNEQVDAGDFSILGKALR